MTRWSGRRSPSLRRCCARPSGRRTAPGPAGGGDLTGRPGGAAAATSGPRDARTHDRPSHPACTGEARRTCRCRSRGIPTRGWRAGPRCGRGGRRRGGVAAAPATAREPGRRPAPARGGADPDRAAPRCGPERSQGAPRAGRRRRRGGAAGAGVHRRGRRLPRRGGVPDRPGADGARVHPRRPAAGVDLYRVQVQRAVDRLHPGLRPRRGPAAPGVHGAVGCRGQGPDHRRARQRRRPRREAARRTGRSATPWARCCSPST